LSGEALRCSNARTQSYNPHMPETERRISNSVQIRISQRRALLEELASRGVRLTAQRRLLVDIIQNAERHLDAAALLEVARKRDPRVNRATVYRTLSLLKRLALVDELDLMHLDGEKHYYEARRQSDHLHLACFRCGKILEYTSPLFEGLKREIAELSDFEISVTRLEVGGVCGDCRASGKPNSSRQ
jgi:Fur family transcriptional regulator, ferric uptake regulator